MLKAFDTAQPLSMHLAVAAATAGFKAVGRYYGSPGSAKLLTSAEVDILAAAGLAVFCYFERTAGRALLGAVAGEEDGQLALATATAVGQPAASGICFAIDTDVNMNDPRINAAVTGYFTAVGRALGGQYRCGVYGDGEACAALVGAGLVDYEILAGAMGWQGSRLYRDGRLWEGLQYPEVAAADSPIGIAIDPVDIVGLYEVGAWSRGAIPNPTATVEPAPAAAPVWTLDRVVDLAGELQEGLAALGLYTGEIDRQIGPMSSVAEMRAYALWRRQKAAG